MLPVKKSEQQLITTSENNSYLSTYADKQLTKNVAEQQFERIKNAYGNKIHEGFFEELSTMLRKNNFTNQKLIDAVDTMIKNEEFPSIAKITNYDKRLRLLNQHEFLKETNEFSADYKKYYQAVNVDGKLFYVHKRQLEDSGIQLTLWESKQPTAVIHNFKPAKTEEELKQEKQPKLNLLQEYLKEYNKIYDSPDGKLLKAAIHRAAMSWGNDVAEYDKAMKEVKHYERKLKLT